MIYLIAGAPRSGKTTLAKMIAKSIGGNYISTDYISSALSSKMSEEEEKTISEKKSKRGKLDKQRNKIFCFFEGRIESRNTRLRYQYQ